MFVFFRSFWAPSWMGFSQDVTKWNTKFKCWFGGFNKIKHFIRNSVNSTIKSQLQIANKYVQFVKEYDTDPNGEGGGGSNQNLNVDIWHVIICFLWKFHEM